MAGTLNVNPSQMSRFGSYAATITKVGDATDWTVSGPAFSSTLAGMTITGVAATGPQTARAVLTPATGMGSGTITDATTGAVGPVTILAGPVRRWFQGL